MTMSTKFHKINWHTNHVKLMQCDPYTFSWNSVISLTKFTNLYLCMYVQFVVRQLEIFSATYVAIISLLFVTAVTLLETTLGLR